MFGDYDNEYDRKRATVALLIQMANADEGVAPIESKFIADVAGNLGLQFTDIVEVAKDPEAFILQPPPDEQARMTILYYLLFTMRVDGEISEKEEQLCYKAGLRLGFNEQLTADLIHVMKTYVKTNIPPDAMLEKIKKYLN